MLNLETILSLLLIIFGILTFLAGIVILINPEIIFGFLRKNLDKQILHILAVVIRLVLGAFLVLESDISRFPLVIEIMGWLSIIAAIILGIIGRRHFNSLMTWSLSLSKAFGRIGGIIALLFGAFLIYAFV